MKHGSRSEKQNVQIIPMSSLGALVENYVIIGQNCMFLTGREKKANKKVPQGRHMYERKQEGVERGIGEKKGIAKEERRKQTNKKMLQEHPPQTPLELFAIGEETRRVAPVYTRYLFFVEMDGVITNRRRLMSWKTTWDMPKAIKLRVGRCWTFQSSNKMKSVWKGFGCILFMDPVTLPFVFWTVIDGLVDKCVDRSMDYLCFSGFL
ncbi:hypothetical protein CDAR_318431 [Caerostris darwini]|uniref:Uncharacterized protein n=1 Tax=Caerostris darwini TaxID=1538125 RepID=A0AAV4PUE1_9ARAC|nr:hypothetical protein CDAR_318431 [Caerostris darwini]